MSYTKVEIVVWRGYGMLLAGPTLYKLKVIMSWHVKRHARISKITQLDCYFVTLLNIVVIA